MKRTLWLTFLLAGISGAVRADRDIVYAARYYAPPGSHRTSHFHLYRINPAGTGKTQLTFGNADDANPQWSPNGRWVAFTKQISAFRNVLYVMRAGGGAARVLMRPGASSTFEDYSYRWSPDGGLLAVIHQVSGGSTVSLIDPETGQISRRFVGVYDFLWSPDGTYAYVRFQNRDQILALVSGRLTGVQAALQQGANAGGNVAWLDSRTLVGIANKHENNQDYLSLFGLNGRESKHVLCRWGSSTQDPYVNSIDPWGQSLLSRPYTRHAVIYEQDEGNSSNRPDNVYYFADTVTGRMTQITTGQFLAWKSGGAIFCTAEARHLANYGKPIQGYQKGVYVAALQIGQVKSEKVNNITPGLAWVTGADWRRSTPGKS